MAAHSPELKNKDSSIELISANEHVDDAAYNSALSIVAKLGATNNVNEIRALSGQLEALKSSKDPRVASVIGNSNAPANLDTLEMSEQQKQFTSISEGHLDLHTKGLYKDLEDKGLLSVKEKEYINSFNPDQNYKAASFDKDGHVIKINGEAASHEVKGSDIQESLILLKSYENKANLSEEGREHLFMKMHGTKKEAATDKERADDVKSLQNAHTIANSVKYFQTSSPEIKHQIEKEQPMITEGFNNLKHSFQSNAHVNHQKALDDLMHKTTSFLPTSSTAANDYSVEPKVEVSTPTVAVATTEIKNKIALDKSDTVSDALKNLSVASGKEVATVAPTPPSAQEPKIETAKTEGAGITNKLMQLASVFSFKQKPSTDTASLGTAEPAPIKTKTSEKTNASFPKLVMENTEVISATKTTGPELSDEIKKLALAAVSLKPPSSNGKDSLAANEANRFANKSYDTVPFDDHGLSASQRGYGGIRIG